MFLWVIPLISLTASLVWGPWHLHGTVLTSTELADSRLDGLRRAVSSDDAKPYTGDVSDRNFVAASAFGTQEAILALYLHPYTYMDEIFHVPQAAAYVVLGNWSHWDSMITTPPGSYAAAVVALRWIFDDLAPSRTSTVDGIVRLANPLAWIDQIARVIESVLPETSSNVQVVDLLAIRPLRAVHTSLLLARRLLSSARRNLATWILDAPARLVTLLRLTNVLVAAVLFTVAWTGSGRLIRLAGEADIELKQQITTTFICHFPVLHLFCGALFYTEALSTLLVVCVCVVAPLPSASFFGGLLRWGLCSILGIAAICVRQTNIVWLAFAGALFGLSTLLSRNGSVAAKAARALTQLLPVAAVGVAFLYWVVVLNGGSVVVGDRSQHKVTVHWAQLSLLLCAFAAVNPISALCEVKRTCTTHSTAVRVSIVFTSLAVGCLAASAYHAHPFVLADNRHVTFYLHRYVFRSANARVLLLGIGASVGAALFLSRRIWQNLLLLAFAAIAVVPQGLVEPRYWILPCLLWRLLNRSSSAAALYDALWNIVLGVGALILFTQVTFPGHGGRARWMW